MRWYHYIAYFFGGAFLANTLPHLGNGISGHPFQSPFASPPGEGLSSSTVNVLWGLFNLAVGYLLEDIGAHVVDHRDEGLHQQLRPQIGVAPADAGRGVYHGGHPAPDQGLRADPVKVGMIDDRDVAGLQPLGEILGPAVQASRR